MKLLGRVVTILISLAVAATTASAFERVEDRDRFIDTVRGKALPGYRDAIDRYLAAEGAGGAVGVADSCSPVSTRGKTKDRER